MAKNAKFCYILVNCSVTITRTFTIFGALFLHFEYAYFDYHKLNITDFFHTQIHKKNEINF